MTGTIRATRGQQKARDRFSHNVAEGEAPIRGGPLLDGAVDGSGQLFAELDTQFASSGCNGSNTHCEPIVPPGRSIVYTNHQFVEQSVPMVSEGNALGATIIDVDRLGHEGITYTPYAEEAVGEVDSGEVPEVSGRVAVHAHQPSWPGGQDQ